jgi:phospholipid/cholesterol/gamma-HCH transport system substrate-binding protein
VSAVRRIAAGAVLVAVVVVLFLVLRGETGTPYRLRFENAGQLVKGGEVQVGGKRIGSIQDLALTDANQAEITIRVQGDVAPLHEGTTAAIRATSLSGAANRYITLVPGPNSNEELDDNAVIAADRTEPVVDIDQLLNALDPKTRKGLQQVTSGFARWYEGKGEEANAGVKYFSPAVGATRRLVAEVARDQGTLVDFLRNTSKAMKAIGERRTELTALVSNTGRTMDAIGSEDAALEQALRFLPGTLRKGNTTFVNLRATLDDLDVLVEESKPATKDLAPLFRELRPLVRDARPTVRDLSKLVRTDGASNDLTDLLRTAPSLARATEPALEHSREALRAAVPSFTFSRPYGPELIAWLRDFGLTAGNYDANGHYGRVAPSFMSHAFTDTPAGGELRPIPPEQRYDGFTKRVERRCPGAATQPASDGSSPFADEGNTNACDPSQVPPGP